MLSWVREKKALLFLLIEFCSLFLNAQKGRFKYTAMLFIN